MWVFSSSFFFKQKLEFVQDVATHGLGLVFDLSDPENKIYLANLLISQLNGVKCHVKQVNDGAAEIKENVLGKMPIGLVFNWVNYSFVSKYYVCYDLFVHIYPYFHLFIKFHNQWKYVYLQGIVQLSIRSQ